MTSLLISFPDIPQQSLTIDVDTAADDLNQADNIISGRRGYFHKSSGTPSSLTFSWDLGTGNTYGVDHLIIARADLLQLNSEVVGSVSLDGSNGAYSAVHTNASLASATLTGPRQQDYLWSQWPTVSTAYNLWRLVFSSGSGSPKYRFSKAYFGQFFDMGIEPSEYKVNRVAGKAEFFSSDGTRHFSRQEEPLYEIEFLWRGVTDATAQDFIKKAQDKRYQGCFLYADTYTDVLGGEELIHCMIEDAQIEQVWNDWNIVTARFKEYGD